MCWSLGRALMASSKMPCPVLCSLLSVSLQPHGLQPARLLCPWDFPGKNTGVGCHFLLQGIFWTPGSILHFLHYRLILYHWATWEARSPSIQQCIHEVAIMRIPLGATRKPAGVKRKNLWREACWTLNHIPPQICVFSLHLQELRMWPYLVKGSL